MSKSRRAFVKTVGSALSLSTLGSGVGRAGEESGAALPAMARRLADCSAEEALDVAAQMLASGTHWHHLLGAVLLAGANHVRPNPVGFKLHALFVVGSAFQLAEASSGRERLIPVLYCVDELKKAQADDIRRGDWHMPELPKVSIRNEAEARSAYIQAMDNWDQDGADRAVIALHRHLDRDTLFELMWPYAMRDCGNLGHKAIFVAQAHHSLTMMPWATALPLLRSLTFGLLVDGEPHFRKDFADNKALLATLPKHWTKGKRDEQASFHFMAELRSLNSTDAGEMAATMLRDGIHPQSIWDGIRLFAGDILFRSPGLLEVHAATSVNALYMASERSSHTSSKQLSLLQAASWMVLLRNDFKERRGLSMEGAGLESLQAEKGAIPTVTDVFQKAGDNKAEAGAMMLSLLRRQGAAAEIKAQMRSLLARKGEGHHVYKYTASVHMDHAASSPGAAGHVLATSLNYLPNLQTPDVDIYRRISAVLSKMG